MLILGEFSRHNLIKIYTKRHQTVPYFKNFLEYHMLASELLKHYMCATVL